MDLALVKITPLEKQEYEVSFCGAKRPLYHTLPNEKEVLTLKEIRKSIGGFQNHKVKFETQKVILPQDSILYLGSDGLEDQNNFKRKKFGVKRIKSILQKNAFKSLEIQKQELEQALDEHMKDTLQRDDILWLGVRL